MHHKTGQRRREPARAALVLAAITLLAACAAPASPHAGRAETASPGTETARLTGTAASPTATTRRTAPAVRKVLVFVEENHSLGEMRAGMPYTFSLAKRYGYATDYRALTHPSLPNYLGIAGGRTAGVADDNSPSAHELTGRSVFSQALAHHKTAAVYAESMPSSCATEPSGRYAVKHNPWAYFVNERTACAKHDVPFGRFAGAVSHGRLPNVGMVIPNLCHDAHDCGLGAADRWFRRAMRDVLAGPDWQSGHLAVVLTADEDDSAHGNRILTVVINPTQHHHVVTNRLSHYSLTRLLEDVVGAPHLHHASTAPSMSRAFGLHLG